MTKRLTLFAWMVVFALGAGAQSIPGPRIVDAVEKQSKLSSELRDLAGRHRSSERVSAQHDPALAQDDTIQVVVETTAADVGAVKEHVRSLGGRFETSAGNLVLARVPVPALDALANAGSEVRVVRRPQRPVPFRTTTEGVKLIGADVWHGLGRRGAGVKVAILDVGFDGYRSLMGSELPEIPDARVRSFSGDITGDANEHGTGVAEIVYDVAPDAILYLVNFSNEVELQNAVDWLIQERVDVINSSWGYPCGGPVDGTGLVNAAVKRAADAGIIWVASAGNFAQQHWMGNFSDSNGDKWHNFAANAEGNTVSMASGGELRVCVQWDDWANRDQDLDLYVWNSAGSVVASSSENQSGPTTHEPWERLDFTASVAGDYYIGVKRFSGTRNLRLQLYAYEPGAECAVQTVVETQAAPRGILEELRHFRSDVLASTPAGQELTRAYYRHSAEVRRILLRHPGLAIDAARLLKDLRPALRSVLEGGSVDITPENANRIDAFVAELTALGGPELRDALTELRTRAAISTAGGQSAAQYWRTFLNGDRLGTAPNNYPEAGYMLHRVEQTSVVPPADSAHALTIGAVEAATGAVRDFTSQGPTADGRRKPDLAAPDGVCTTTYGNCAAGGFAGTSAAAPHAAGAVALVRNAFPALSLSGVRDFLTSRAMDIAPSGPDNVTGAGRLALESTGPDVFPAPVISGPKGFGVALAPAYVWSEVTGAMSYRIMVARFAEQLPNDPGSTTCIGCLVNTTRSVPYVVPAVPLVPNTIYFWQVQATTGTRNSRWTQTSFLTTTAPEQRPPDRGDTNENAGGGLFAARAVVITHGYNSDATSWVQQMAEGICNEKGSPIIWRSAAPADSFTRVCRSDAWDIWVLDWRGEAYKSNGDDGQTPRTVVKRAAVPGERLASLLKVKNYAHVHLIAHSAGSNLIHSATTQLKRAVPGLTIHETFLDAFDPAPVSKYGDKADWADHYVDTRSVYKVHLGYDDTKWFLDHAFNVDVTPAADNDGCDPLCRHDRPYRFYGKSIISTFAANTADPLEGLGGTGFGLSVERGKTLSSLATTHPKNLTCTIVGEACNYTVRAPRTWPLKKVLFTRSVRALQGQVTFTPGVSSLFDSLKLGSAALSSSSLSHTVHVTSSQVTDPPAWLVVDVTTPEPANTLRFQWKFRAAGEGFLRIFVDGMLVRELDQRHLSTASAEAEEVFIGGAETELAPGPHTIVFRLDGFGTAPSAVELTAVELVQITPSTRRRAARH